MSFGWAGQILRIDLSKTEFTREDVEPYTRSFIGGRGINVKVAYDEVAPRMSPFDPDNRLCFGPGVLAGTLAPASSRTKVTAVSPNGLMASSGIGGSVGAEIKWAGYDNIVIQGKSDEPVYLYIRDGVIEFRDASHIWGKGTQETQRAIEGELGNSPAVMCIGPGGENRVSFACILTQGSAAGRRGLGAVMGSKNLKAIAVKGTGQIGIAKPDEFIDACLQARKQLLDNPVFKRMSQGGMGDRRGSDAGFQNSSLTWGNFEERDPGSDELRLCDAKGEEAFYNRYASHMYGCHNCPVHHFYIFDAPGIGTGAMKCMARSTFTTSIWNNDWKVMFHANHLCNQYGLDPIASSNVISFLMELYKKGIITEKDTDGIAMRRGDGEAIISVIHKIGKQEGFGKLFRNGVLEAARVIGKDAEHAAMAVKGQEMEPFEYRLMKSFALIAALTGVISDGAEILDHRYRHASLLSGGSEEVERLAEELYGSKEPIIWRSYEKKGLLVWDYMNRVTAMDLTGTCTRFVPGYLGPSLATPAELLSLATGRDVNEADLLNAAQRVHTLERAFDVLRGIRRRDDTLPDRLFETPVLDAKYEDEKLDREQFNHMLDEYYALRGWDEEGIPTEETFRKYDLLAEWEAFQKEG